MPDEKTHERAEGHRDLQLQEVQQQGLQSCSSPISFTAPVLIQPPSVSGGPVNGRSLLVLTSESTKSRMAGKEGRMALPDDETHVHADEVVRRLVAHEHVAARIPGR